MNILERANEIVNLRKEEKERNYGPFEEGMAKAARIASELTNKVITTEDMYKCMMALKLSRESYNHGEDNLLDLVAYVGSLNNTYEDVAEKEGVVSALDLRNLFFKNRDYYCNLKNHTYGNQAIIDILDDFIERKIKKTYDCKIVGNCVKLEEI